MARSDRLLRLLQAMRVMPQPITALRLAQATEVSLRSLYRDIDSLRSAGARIEGERGYGYRLIEDSALPPQTLTRTEIEAIALGMAEVQAMGDPILATAALSVLAKVGATLPDESEQHLFHAISQVFRPIERFASSNHVDTIRQACWIERAIIIAYTDLSGAMSERMIFPLAIVYTDRTMCVLAWCCMREAFRMFRLDRINTVQPTNKSFRPKRVVLLREYLADLTRRRREHESSEDSK